MKGRDTFQQSYKTTAWHTAWRGFNKVWYNIRYDVCCWYIAPWITCYSVIYSVISAHCISVRNPLRHKKVVAAVTLHPKFLTLLEFYLGLSLVARLLQLYLNLSHTHTTKHFSAFSHDGHLSSVNTVAQCIPAITHQEILLCRIFWSPGERGVEMTSIVILEYKLLWLKQTRTISNITTLHRLYWSTLKSGCFCSHTLQSYGDIWLCRVIKKHHISAIQSIKASS